ncbi:nuclear transport factor 2 family protein [Saccharopolyspora sp. 5N708]|uniref:nuclear transport factor 2 family protein n=1 Tax=Saccharopolyspora sp. 5N708 TaxID=3457424 RepID=UPI003FD0FB0F
MNETPTTAPLPGALAAQLVNAAGDPDKITAFLAEDVTWWIADPDPGPDEIVKRLSYGREKVRENLKKVFSALYDGNSVRTVVHRQISQGNLGTVRWSMSGELATGGKFENEYSLWVEVNDGLVTKVLGVQRRHQGHGPAGGDEAELGGVPALSTD